MKSAKTIIMAAKAVSVVSTPFYLPVVALASLLVLTYLNLLTSGELNKHLYEVEQTALTRLELLTKQLCKEQGVTEELKEKAPMQWVGLMNNIRSQAEETILTELIYS